MSTDDGKRIAELWKATFLETSAKQNEAVADVFHSILLQIEKDNGNPQEKGNCCIS